jgi:hypothetical protein
MAIHPKLIEQNKAFQKAGFKVKNLLGAYLLLLPNKQTD